MVVREPAAVWSTNRSGREESGRRERVYGQPGLQSRGDEESRGSHGEKNSGGGTSREDPDQRREERDGRRDRCREHCRVPVVDAERVWRYRPHEFA